MTDKASPLAQLCSKKKGNSRGPLWLRCCLVKVNSAVWSSGEWEEISSCTCALFFFWLHAAWVSSGRCAFQSAKSKQLPARTIGHWTCNRKVNYSTKQTTNSRRISKRKNRWKMNDGCERARRSNSYRREHPHFGRWCVQERHESRVYKTETRGAGRWRERWT